MSTFKKIVTHIHFAPVSLLVSILVIFIISQFPSTTNLIGWDAVSPELNYSANFSRALNSSWQENYGLGALIGHGVGTTFIHTGVVYLIDLFAPSHAVRAIFHFLSFSVGAVGMYFLSYHILSSLKNDVSKQLLTFISLLAALFYTFNLGTTQLFYLPLEAFSVHFAGLPWALLLLLRYIHSPSKKNLFILFIVNIFFSMQGFIPSLFVAYLFSIGVYTTTFFLLNKNKKKNGTHILFALFIILLANSYWLTSFTFYTLFRNQNFLEAYNNLSSTEQFIQQSMKYGDVLNVGLLKSFYLDTSVADTQVFQSWNQFFQNSAILFFYFLFFLVSLLGLIVSTFKRYRKIMLPLSSVYLFFFLGLTTATPPFSFASKLLQLLPLYKQAFRTTFTKLGTGMALSYSIFLGLGLLFLFSKKSKFSHAFLWFLLAISTTVLVLPHFIFPAFYENESIRIPQAYRDVTNEFNQKGYAHIAMLPADCSEGWYNYNWNYVGSGFLWYGVKQPIIERFSDVWSANNEQYFWELSSALHANNTEQLSNIFMKYDIKWLLIDENLEHCSNFNGFSQQKLLIDRLTSSNQFQLIFETDKGVEKPIRILENTQHSNYNFISSSSVTKVSTTRTWMLEDTLFASKKSYVSNPTEILSDEYFVFPSIFSQRGNAVSSSQIENTNATLTFISPEKTNTDRQINLVVSYAEDPIPFSTTIEQLNDLYSLQMNLDFPLVVIGSQEFDVDTTINLGELSIDETTDIALFLNGHALQNNFGSIDPRINSTLEIKNREGKLLFSWESQKSKQFTETIPNQKKYLISENNVPISIQVTKNDRNHKASAVEGLAQKIPFICNSENNSQEIPTYQVAKDPQYLRLISDATKTCINGQLSFLSSNSGYIIEIGSRNAGGSQPKFNLTNPDGLQLLNIEIANSDTFDTNYYFLNDTSELTAPYSYTIENPSILSETTNDFSSLNFWQVPINMLASMHLKGNEESIDNSVTIISNKRISETLYQLEYISEEPGYLHFYQAFDPAWIAISVKTFKRIPEHYQLNGWANTWKVTEKKDTVLLFYWPQLLVLAGYLLFSSTLIAFAIYLKKEKHELKYRKKQAKKIHRTPKRVLAGRHKRRTK